MSADSYGLMNFFDSTSAERTRTAHSTTTQQQSTTHWASRRLQNTILNLYRALHPLDHCNLSEMHWLSFDKRLEHAVIGSHPNQTAFKNVTQRFVKLFEHIPEVTLTDGMQWRLKKHCKLNLHILRCFSKFGGAKRMYPTASFGFVYQGQIFFIQRGFTYLTSC